MDRHEWEGFKDRFSEKAGDALSHLFRLPVALGALAIAVMLFTFWLGKLIIEQVP